MSLRYEHLRQCWLLKSTSMNRNACVVGAGPNGLAAAIVLSRAGIKVDILQAESTPGGAVRTMPSTDFMLPILPCRLLSSRLHAHTAPA
jgi:protoporphyrinogen oxidase